MHKVTVSRKFQIVIPKKLREQMNLKPGEILHIYFRDGLLTLRRPRSIAELRGVAKGIRWNDGDRDHSERF